ncbi:MAG TPA: hypothetical protein VG184_12565 [Acidimicrobiales bacterium]|nr:hypothetical protein [Acidimicrobiales bacterium]
MPGLDGAGRPVCVDCAGIATSFLCATCGTEGELWFARTCLRCSLRRRLATALDDGTGNVKAELMPLFEAMAAMADPWPGLTWLNTAHVRKRLGALATGEVALSHDGVDTLPAGQGREYLRELLVAHGILASADKYLMAYQRWEATRLDTIENPDDRHHIRVYLRWRHHRELAARAEAAPLTGSVVATARMRTNAALRFLGWLRARDTELGRCAQADLDDWFATASNPRAATDFLVWAMRHQRCPHLTLPTHRRRSPTAAPADQRAAALIRLLSDDRIDLVDRVAGCMVLVLAQPVTRITTIRLADIDYDNDDLRVRLGEHPIVLPQPLARVIVALIDQRPHLATAANPTSPWLFPGTAPGRPLCPEQLSHRLGRLGITAAGRQAAMKQLISEVPAPLLAEALGYHPQTTARRAAEQGADWAAYAALKARQTAQL